MLVDVFKELRAALAPYGVTLQLGGEHLFDNSVPAPRVVVVPINASFEEAEQHALGVPSIATLKQDVQLHLWAVGEAGAEGSDFSACEQLRSDLLHALRSVTTALELVGESWPVQDSGELMNYGRSLIIEIQLRMPVVPSDGKATTTTAVATIYGPIGTIELPSGPETGSPSI